MGNYFRIPTPGSRFDPSKYAAPSVDYSAEAAGPSLFAELQRLEDSVAAKIAVKVTDEDEEFHIRVGKEILGIVVTPADKYGTKGYAVDVPHRNAIYGCETLYRGMFLPAWSDEGFWYPWLLRAARMMGLPLLQGCNGVWELVADDYCRPSDTKIPSWDRMGPRGLARLLIEQGGDREGG